MADTDRLRDAAKRAKRGRARARSAFLDARMPDVDRAAVSAATARVVERELAAPRSGRRSRSARAAPRAFPAVDVQRWVPIGPSIVRQGQAVGRPRVTGRVRDIAIDPTAGLRMYAATAKGGVWYSRDGGSTWDPVGGWTARTRAAGGTNSAHACGCLLVHFDPVDEAQDLVLIGTGEPPSRVASITAVFPGGVQRDDIQSNRPRIQSVGVLAARGPVTQPVGTEPWEGESGLAQMENMAIYRLVRDPAATPGKTANPNRDRVVAATSRGAFLGLRTRVPASGATPAHDEFRWTAIAPAATPLAGTPVITDALWLTGGGADGRVVLAIAGPGATQRVVVCTNITDNGTRAFTTIGGVATTASTRVSLAHATGDRIYVLGETGGAPTVWQVPSVSVAAPAGAVVAGTPANLWGTQRDYDQAIAVDVVGGTDRVFLGGSVIQPTPADQWGASLWAFDVRTAPPPLALVGAPFVSVPGVPNAAGRAGADQAGLIGNNLHGDVHSIRLAGAAANRHVWVTCDGGIYQSTQAGRVNSFLPRSTGLAVVEVGYHAPHPTSSHFGAVGSQDTGSQVRVGDTVWEQTFLADGGGVVFHPTRSQYVIAQNNTGMWLGQPTNGYVSPVARVQGGGAATATYAPENGAAAFYSGADAIARTATESRVAIGTNRVWLSDDIGAVVTNTWRVIGFPNGAGADQAASNAVGVPPGALGSVLRLRWASPTNLLALYQQGVVRYTEAGANWTATVIAPGAPGAPVFAIGNEIFADIAPVPGTNDFYLTTTGNTGNNLTDTCWFFDSTAAPATFVATGLRRVLDSAPGANDGPLDPAYAVIVDPAQTTDVYVGTVSGVWRGVRPAPPTTPHGWTPLVNGLPEALVQDLAMWADPGGAASPRLLRASIQARGVWEVDLSAANEPQRTYIRVHERDDRRRIPTPMQNPRRRPGAVVELVFACPDIVVRPRWPVAAAPRWLLGAGTIDANDRPGYQLWTFQTAFRWRFPSIVADGQWSDQLGDLIEQFRFTAGGALAAGGRVVDRGLWDAVVGGTRLDAAGQVTNAAGDPRAVYRAPWQHAGALTAFPTEIDLMETVRPERVQADVWRVHKEQVTVDVLLHHRDSRPLPVGDAFAILLWRARASQALALGGNVAAFPAFARSLLTAAPDPNPAGWNLAVDAGSGVHRLALPLDARLPKAVSIDVDLRAVPDWHRVALVAIVGSTTDPLTTAPSGAVNSLEQLVQRWPHAGLRLVQMVPRP